MSNNLEKETYMKRQTLSKVVIRKDHRTKCNVHNFGDGTEEFLKSSLFSFFTIEVHFIKKMGETPALVLYNFFCAIIDFKSKTSHFLRFETIPTSITLMHFLCNMIALCIQYIGASFV